VNPFHAQLPKPRIKPRVCSVQFEIHDQEKQATEPLQKREGDRVRDAVEAVWPAAKDVPEQQVPESNETK
jgi:hypothetical protein